MTNCTQIIERIDREIIAATQDGLPLVPEPYDELACRVGISADELRSRMQRMLDLGIIRRIGAVPNHYALGLSANGMSVWDVDDEAVSDLGAKVGALDFVSHCYRRPRHPPFWPYNLFAMVHGRDRAEVEAKISVIAGLLGSASHAHEILYSTRILKKTGLRIAA
jgi:DNA-binding Lrp family transcriptional regulator